jgi:hypothetical protein
MEGGVREVCWVVLALQAAVIAKRQTPNLKHQKERRFALGAETGCGEKSVRIAPFHHAISSRRRVWNRRNKYRKCE